MALNTKMRLDLGASYTSALDLATTISDLNFSRQVNLASGTGPSQADKLWHDSRTLAASASEDLDLAGALTDAFGVTLALLRVKGLVIAAASTNTNNVVIGNAAANGWVGPFGAATHTLSVRPGGILALFASDATAYAVTAGTGDLLHVANSGAGSGVSYDVIVIGASA